MGSSNRTIHTVLQDLKLRKHRIKHCNPPTKLTKLWKNNLFNR